MDVCLLETPQEQKHTKVDLVPVLVVVPLEDDLHEPLPELFHLLVHVLDAHPVDLKIQMG